MPSTPTEPGAAPVGSARQPVRTGGLPGLLGLMQLGDSALPTGAFSHSLGMESYLHDERVHDEDTMAAWLRMFIAQQLTYTDALAVRLALQAQDFAQVADLDELVTVQALPQQIRDGGMTMGRRLLAVAAESFPDPWLERYRQGVQDGTLHAHQAVVWAVAARALGVGEDEAVAGHLQATAIALTQNAVRGMPMGQSAGQRVIRRAQDWILQAVEVSRELGPEDLGAIAPGLEIAQILHESQRARLFMS